MTESKPKQKIKFTIYHGFVVSIALHSALGMPFVAHDLEAPVKETSPLVVDLQGVVADRQTEQKDLRETAEQQPKPSPAPEVPPPPEPPITEASANPAPAPPQEPPAKDVVEEKEAAPPPPKPVTHVVKTSPTTAKPKSRISSLQHGPRADERQNAETIRADPESEHDRLSDYVKLLARRVQENLVYPTEARQARIQGTATVSFTILPDGALEPDSLKVTVSSGQPELDASALKTVRSSDPFDPPPKQITVAIGVAFGPQQ